VQDLLVCLLAIILRNSGMELTGVVSYSNVSALGSPSYHSELPLSHPWLSEADEAALPTENSIRIGGTLRPGTNSPENGTSPST
jgi:hypothetical protein